MLNPNPDFQPPNTKLKTQIFLVLETPNRNLKSKPWSQNQTTCNLKFEAIKSKWNQPQTSQNRINLKFAAFFFLVFAWGVDLRGHGREEKRDREDGIVWVLMKKRG